jgi:aspartate/methionine/tyrosine aminotransferase
MAPPVMAARAWLAAHVPDPDRPLINMSQAAPMDPPPEALRRAIAEAALTDPAAHLYGPVLGLPRLRAVLAERWAADYGGAIGADQVAITAGCNQAFCAAVATLAGPGDRVILPFPWYFNHRMWLDMAGIETAALPCGPGLLPDPDRAAALIDARTRAIVLVTPNNPGGVEYPAGLVHAFADLARARGLALILDETYRDFDSRPGPPHHLFHDPDWDAGRIHLYSFSKAFRLTGHRVGALFASPARIAEAEKFLDTVTICPGQLGQQGALWGLLHLRDWLAGERAEILARRAAMTAGFATLPGWRLLGCGACFAYAGHPCATDAETVARALLAEQSVLTLPGTMFAPPGDPAARHQIRFAFANADRAGIATLFERLRDFTAAHGQAAAAHWQRSRPGP